MTNPAVKLKNLDTNGKYVTKTFRLEIISADIKSI